MLIHQRKNKSYWVCFLLVMWLGIGEMRGSDWLIHGHVTGYWRIERLWLVNTSVITVKWQKFPYRSVFFSGNYWDWFACKIAGVNDMWCCFNVINFYVVGWIRTSHKFSNHPNLLKNYRENIWPYLLEYKWENIWLWQIKALWYSSLIKVINIPRSLVSL